jgi:hypothetical protein
MYTYNVFFCLPALRAIYSVGGKMLRNYHMSAIGHDLAAPETQGLRYS